MSTGRPATYTVELADIVCSRLAAGESMCSISKDEDMPAKTTLFKWIREIEEFTHQYARAKEESADALVEDMLDIADNQVSQPVLVDGVPMVIDGQLVQVVDAVSVNHARLRVDTRKWAASKLQPRKYGDIKNINVKADLRLTDLSDEELARRLNQLEQAADD